MGVPVAASHSRTVRSRLPVAITGLPSSCPNAIEVTGLVWPVNGSPMGVPAAASHSRTVLSLLPVAMTGLP
jgi:hypothetical protein